MGGKHTYDDLTRGMLKLTKQELHNLNRKHKILSIIHICIFIFALFNSVCIREVLLLFIGFYIAYILEIFIYDILFYTNRISFDRLFHQITGCKGPNALFFTSLLPILYYLSVGIFIMYVVEKFGLNFPENFKNVILLVISYVYSEIIHIGDPKTFFIVDK